MFRDAVRTSSARAFRSSKMGLYMREMSIKGIDSAVLNAFESMVMTLPFVK